MGAGAESWLSPILKAQPAFPEDLLCVHVQNYWFRPELLCLLLLLGTSRFMTFRNNLILLNII